MTGFLKSNISRSNNNTFLFYILKLTDSRISAFAKYIFLNQIILKTPETFCNK